MFQLVGHMQMASSVATPDQGNGIARLRACHAAADGKLRDSNAKMSQTTAPLLIIRQLIFAIATLFVATVVYAPASYAETGPFAGMAGNWSGSGTITLDDGAIERIRCRSSYAVGAAGAGLNLNLICASDGYKFDLKGNVIADHGALSGSWTESSRGVNGILEGRGANGNFEVLATTLGFAARISLMTRGNRQSVVIKGESGFKGATMSLSRY